MYHLADPYILPLQASKEARWKAVSWFMARNRETFQNVQQNQKDNRETWSWGGLGIWQDTRWAGEEINMGLSSVMSYSKTLLPLIIWTEA